MKSTLSTTHVIASPLLPSTPQSSDMLRSCQVSAFPVVQHTFTAPPPTSCATHPRTLHCFTPFTPIPRSATLHVCQSASLSYTLQHHTLCSSTNLRCTCHFPARRARFSSPPLVRTTVARVANDAAESPFQRFKCPRRSTVYPSSQHFAFDKHVLKCNPARIARIARVHAHTHHVCHSSRTTQQSRLLARFV
jgi:hypothetical protein